jgi:hypothetical protein
MLASQSDVGMLVPSVIAPCRDIHRASSIRNHVIQYYTTQPPSCNPFLLCNLHFPSWKELYGVPP